MSCGVSAESFLGSSINQGGNTNIMRTMPQYVNINDQFTIDLDLSIGQGDTYILFEEQLPLELEFISLTSSNNYEVEYNPSTHKITGYSLSTPINEVISYTVKAPNNEQSLRLVGYYMVEGDELLNLINGQMALSVMEEYVNETNQTNNETDGEQILKSEEQILCEATEGAWNNDRCVCPISKEFISSLGCEDEKINNINYDEKTQPNLLFLFLLVGVILVLGGKNKKRK